MIKYIFGILTLLVLGVLTTLVLILPTPVPSATQTQLENNATTLWFKDMRVFTGNTFINNTQVLVKDGLIVKIAAEVSPDEVANAKVIQGDDLTLMPGIIDAHTHSYGNALKDTLRFGVTAHLDMFTNEVGLATLLQQRQSLQPSTQADLFSSGTLATVDGGHGTQYGFAIDTLSSSADAAEWVRNRKALGVDYIKLVYMPNQQRIPSLDKTTAVAVINQAHAQGLKALAHISTMAAAADLIAADIDGLVHIFADEPISDEMVALAVQKDVFVIPTLSVLAAINQQPYNLELLADERIFAKLSAQQTDTLKRQFLATPQGFDYAIAQQNIYRLHRAGVTILAGSDAPNAGTAYGVSAYQEIVLLNEAGLSPTAALAAATHNTAQRFALKDRGVIEVGKRADLVVINGDPRVNIDNIFNLAKVFKNGAEVQQALAKINKGAPLTTSLLGDFENDAMHSAGPFSWSQVDDHYANGNSSASIVQVATGGVDNSGGLLVSGQIGNDFSYPWAGATIGDFTPPIEALDVSAFSYLVFDVKGTAGDYRVMSFTSDTISIPPTQYFTITPQWQTHRIALAAFDGVDLTRLTGLAFVAGSPMTEFTFTLDNVRFE